ncbi:hypothetical protein F4678DRAFT_181475 [Xylaria arbuscula]|nr:hypothetical protein F4678DRAFT_181475 [Xylaria arbuscula]
MQTLPYVQVRDLPPSASFYSAVTQPLGLRFTSAGPSSIVFGSPDPTFEVKTSANAPQPTRMILSVSSPSVVSAFHAAARRANLNGNSNILLKDDDGVGGESRASATDLEGNVIEVVYLPTQSSAKQATRILDWNLNAATMTMTASRSVAGSIAQSRPGLAALMPTGDDESYRIIRRCFTSSTVESSPIQQQQQQEEDSKGLSTGAMLGTVLGAVAAGALGAGLAYTFIKKERDRAPRQQFEAPPFQRRATYPEPYPDHQPRYVELERTVEKVRYPEQYPPGSNRYSQPAYTTRRPETGSPPVEVDDRANRRNPEPRMRDRSVGSTRKPLMITETEHKSNVGSQHPEPPHPVTVEAEDGSQVGSRQKSNAKSQLHAELFKRRQPAPSTAPSKAPSKAASQAPDTRSHVSSRSRRGDDDRRSHAGSRHSTVRHRRSGEAETYVSARSEKSATTVRPIRTRTESKAPSRAASYVSVRDIPTPPKEEDWKDLIDDDDKASVAPSDSISCVGEERPKPHARDIPFLQRQERIIIQ